MDHKNYFEDTLDKLYEAAIATEQNPQWDQYVAQLSRQRAQQAALDHQARMQTRQADTVGTIEDRCADLTPLSTSNANNGHRTKVATGGPRRNVQIPFC